MYSFAQVGAIEKKSNSSFFNDCFISRTNYTCTGIVHCEYLDPKIKEMYHTEVTPSMLDTIRQVRVHNGRDSQEIDANRLVIHSKYIKYTFH
jgi:hypothetical protein